MQYKPYNEFVSLTTLCFLLAFSCKPKQNISAEKIVSKVEQREIIINQEYSPPSRLDFTIDSGKVVDKTLSLYVKYTGGCKPHDFQIVATNFIKKSLPPQTELFLIHNTNNDSCFRPLEKVLNFNLSKLNLNQFETIILDVNHQVYINFFPNPNQPNNHQKK